MMRHAINLLFVGSLCSLAAGCLGGQSTPTSPLLAFTPGPAPTVFAGTASDSANGTGTVTVSLNSAAGLTSGLWQMTFGGKTQPQYFISGTLSGSAYTANVTTCTDNGNGSNCVTDCAFTFAGTLTGTSLGGTYTATSNKSCPGRSGNVNAAKQ